MTSGARPGAFDIRRFLDPSKPGDQYRRQIKRLADDGKSTESIEVAVDGALKTMQSGAGHKSFVVYGEPQSGKTEMMICLTARLLDEGFTFIIHLLNDSIGLLEQNLGRFHSSGLTPSARDFGELLDRATDIGGGHFVVFGKKSGSHLGKLLQKLDGRPGVIVIDDEADYATIRSQADQQEKAAINGLIEGIIGDSGYYIGVTAMPARLNLSSTFENDSSLWVDAPPHPAYTGQDQFFPMNLYTQGVSSLPYRLTLLPDQGDDPTHERDALLRFLVNVAHLNLSTGKERNFSMLAHTSSLKVDYKIDFRNIRTTLDILTDHDHRKFEEYVQLIWSFAYSSYPGVDADNITQYIIQNIGRSSIFVLNTESVFRKYGHRATNPSSLFTFVIGGNIVSRGVTFNNLLSMFFPRDVKHRLQQDTYIQRARMFGSRGDYLDHFELTIPRDLFFDWHRCFVYHRLALASIKSGLGSPVWIADKRIAAVSSPNVDQSTVDMDRGEMSFATFDYDPGVDLELEEASTITAKIEVLQRFLPEPSFPPYLRSFILQSTTGGELGLKVFPTADVFPSMTEEEKERIGRRRGFLTIREQDRAGGNVHFLRIFKNGSGRARLFYKIEGAQRFLKNLS